jgi:WD40 repeat protein/serine/threonine protein kinase
MPDLKSCPRCGAQLRPQDSEGFCTRCLLTAGLDGSPEDPKETVLAEIHAHLIERKPQASNQEQGEVRAFGDYELLDEIARGGMGVVYRARQRRLERIVAVKMILGGQFASKQTVQRFRAEVTAAALLQHPNIVAIHDVGIHDDQHYFSMDYVEGQNLSQLVGNRPLPPKRAARYVQLIAEAIHYAHGQGILHRDLKPSNVLVDSAMDQPRITDFGLAKRLDGESSLTGTGQVLGSPSFVPPEQAAGAHGKVGRRSDIYSLGAILYHLLTARPPFQGETLTDVLNQVINNEPLAPHLLTPRVPQDLETICLKCLQKELPDRYQTAQDLADDLGRYLRDEPIKARPVNRIEKAWRWCRRKPAIASLSAATGLLLLAVAVGSPIAVVRYKSQRERADQNAYDADMSLAQHAWDEEDLGRTLSLLKNHLPQPGGTDRRGFEWYYFWGLCRGEQRLTLPTHSQPVTALAMSIDGKRVATGSVGNPVQIWDTATGKPVTTLPEQNVVSLAFAPDGQMLAVGGQDQVVVWDVATKRVVFRREEALARFRVAFSRQGPLLALGLHGGQRAFGKDGGSTELWDCRTGELKRRFPMAGGFVALSPRGDQLATGNTNQAIIIWDLSTGKMIQTVKAGGVADMAWSPDGQTLATCYATSGDVVKLWNVASGLQIRALTNKQQKASCLAFSPDGKSLATGGSDQTVRIWDPVTGQQIEQFKGHGKGVISLAYSGDGQTLATGGKDKTAMLWDVHPNPLVTTVSNIISRPLFCPDGRSVAAGVEEDEVVLWEVATLQVKERFAGALHAIAFLDDGRSLLTEATNSFLQTFDVTRPTARESVRCEAGQGFGFNAVLSPNGKILAAGLTNGSLTFSDVKTGVLIATIPQAFASNIFQLAFSPKGNLLASAGREFEAGRVPAAKVWDVTTHKLVKLLAGHTDEVLGIAFSPDAKTLATCSGDNSIKFWDTSTWREILPSLEHKEHVISTAYSPNGRRLASTSTDGILKLWNVATHREVASLNLGAWPAYMTISPDGQSLVTLQNDSLRLWRAPVPETSQSRGRAD